MKRYLITLLLILLALPLQAQPTDRLQIVRVDSSNFPLMRFNLRAEDGQRVPYSLGGLGGLILRENGELVADYELTAVPVGVDLLFVLDVNETVTPQVDGSTPRLDLMLGVVERYASQFMSLSDLDRVTLIVPNDGYSDGRFLLQDATSPDAVRTAVASYTPPDEPPDTPLQEMITLGLDHLIASAENGRFQALFLLSDAHQLNDQLDFDGVTETAVAHDIPLYTAILGPTATTQAINSASQLATPSRAGYVHVTQVGAVDSLYLVWQRQSNQAQIRYTSPVRRGGPQIVAVSLGELTHTFTFDLTLLPPDLVIGLGNLITRQGAAHDTPLTDLEPIAVEFPVAVTWPDEKPRRLAEFIWTIDEQPQPAPDSLIPDADGQLWLTWPLADFRPDTYEIRAAARDEWGLSSTTEPLLVRLVAERPLPPTPTPEPTPVPGVLDTMATTLSTALATAVDTVVTTTGEEAQDYLPLLLVTGLAALFLLLVRYRRRRWSVAPTQTAPSSPQPRPPPTPVGDGRLPVLELVGDGGINGRFLPLASDNVTLGRDRQAVDIVFNDRSVSLLHARIRRRDDAYWLYDEGSSDGTELNYERLGLAPRNLNDGDQIHLGRVQLRFHLLPAELIAALEEEE
jgi:hypothetical protein